MLKFLKNIWKNFNFQYVCGGDSGGPIIWEDKKDKKFKKRAYVMGIISRSSTKGKICGLAKNDYWTTITTSVPGKVLPWINDFKHREMSLFLFRHRMQ